MTDAQKTTERTTRLLDEHQRSTDAILKFAMLVLTAGLVGLGAIATAASYETATCCTTSDGLSGAAVFALGLLWLFIVGVVVLAWWTVCNGWRSPWADADGR